MSAIHGFISHVQSAETTHRFINMLERAECVGKNGTAIALDGLEIRQFASAAEAGVAIVDNLKKAKLSKIGFGINNSGSEHDLVGIISSSSPAMNRTVNICQAGPDAPLDFSAWDGTDLDLVKTLKNIDVPFAVALQRPVEANVLYLASTSIPLYVEFNGASVFFSSQPLKALDATPELDGRMPPPTIEPYSMMRIEMSEKEGAIVTQYSIWRQEEPKTALVVYDRSVELASDALILLMKQGGYDVKILCFTEVLEDGTWAHGVRDKFGVGLVMYDAPEQTIAIHRLSTALGIAKQNKLDVLCFPTSLETGHRHPWDSPALMERFFDLMPYATPHQQRIGLVTPFVQLTQQEIVDLHEKLSQPIKE